MVEWFIAIVGTIFLVIAAYYGYVMRKVFSIVKDAKLLIEDYKGRCTGANRFVFDEATFRGLYPKENDVVLREAWQRLVMDKSIDRDPLDGEWCIRK